MIALPGLVALLLLPAAPESPAGDGPPAIVASDSDCPSAADVRASLADLLGPQERPVTATAAVHIEGESLVVRFRDAATSAGERRIPVATDCGERAATAALLIATWIRTLPAEAPGSPALEARPRAVAAAVPAPVAAPRPLPAVAVLAPPPPPRASASTTELGAAAMVAAGGGFVPGLGVDLRRPLAFDRLGWAMRAALPAARSLAVGAGTARWTRPSIGLGPSLRWSAGPLFVDTDAAVLGGFLFVWGEGYDINRQGASITVGVGGGARIGLHLGARLIACLDASATRWLREQKVSNDVYPEGNAATIGLPAWDAHIGLGLGVLL